MPEPGPVPRVLVVTDRRRLARHTGRNEEDWPALLSAQVAGALAGGADLIQVREPDLDAARLLAFVRRLFATLPTSAAHIVINDRADVAWAAGAAGVHLGERSLPVASVRSLPPGPAWIVGRSVHDPAGVATARDASYLVAGAVTPTDSKPAGWRTLGWEGLSQVVQMADKVPVVAIGGLRPGDAGAVRRAGAAGVAAIGWFLPDRATDVERSVERRVREMCEAIREDP